MNEINVTYELTLEEKSGGSYERQIVVRREHTDSAHERSHNEQVERLIKALGIPRESLNGELQIAWEIENGIGQPQEYSPSKQDETFKGNSARRANRS